MTIDLEERTGRQPIRELIDADLDLEIAADQPAIDLPGLPFHRMLRRLDADDFAFARQRNDAVPSHRVETDGVAVAMQTAAHPIGERRQMPRKRRTSRR